MVKYKRVGLLEALEAGYVLRGAHRDFAWGWRDVFSLSA